MWEKVQKKQTGNDAQEVRKQFDQIKQELNSTYAEIKKEKSPERIN
jgi:hypothetical protein